MPRRSHPRRRALRHRARARGAQLPDEDLDQPSRDGATLLFKGRVRSDKPACAGGREVKLRNTTQPGALSVEDAGSNGKYEFSISDEAIPGKFFTTTAKVERPAYTCAAAKSRKVSPG